MIKHFCDRCKKEEEKEKITVIELINNRGLLVSNRKRAELCSQCVKEISENIEFNTDTDIFIK